MPIFESPDGGNTVYSRELGSYKRKLLQEYDSRTHDAHIIEDKLWGNIRRAARTNPTLQDALERAIMIYQLSKTT